jgi:hypothetical protein
MTTITGITPLPWDTNYDGDPVQIGSESGAFVAMTLPCDAPAAYEENYNDAAYIVKACNAYPTLIQAMRAAQISLNGDGDTDLDSLRRDIQAAYDVLSAALRATQ